jgi:hypothetical protein
LDDGMSSSDSIDAPSDLPPHPEPIAATVIDPAIAGAVDGVGDRFGVLGLEQMISYAEEALAIAREALEELADTGDDAGVSAEGEQTS